MGNANPIRVKSITEFHRLWGLPKPEHPLISVIDYSDIDPEQINTSIGVIFGCYFISITRNMRCKMIYGQQEYDFDEGILYFIAPHQVMRIEKQENLISQPSGWILLIHPDFLWNTPLAKTIKQYEYFNYSSNEALFLSEKEEAIINLIIQNIQQEYHSNIDKFSQNIIISQIETLLNYAERFYQRQFITRKKANHQILHRLEKLLDDYFNNEDIVAKGIPTVQHVANALNLSPGYLSGLLNMLTGQRTQEHIHDKLIEIAKEKLSTTALSVSEIAYELGFEHPQSFSKLFKTKANFSPMEFRQSFNRQN
ncbi:helix-turn-helix domain-containing protein [Ohtaekwangia sp.]|uniref:helix-turn-helix domain-containing protein n=1 Tax=Ohtaekwangia sp. TaxID=2066019 RepID=UPI002F95101B